MSQSGIQPYLCDQEPTFAEAIRWFPDMPKPWGALGWKDHLFEFVHFWNGGLAMPVPGRTQKTEGLEPYKPFAAQVVFFPTQRGGPWSSAAGTYFYDTNSVEQYFEEGQPFLTSIHRDGNLIVEQVSFAHVPGGKRLRRGDEPLFAWNRFTVKELLGRVLRPKEVSVWAHLAKYSITAGMSPGHNFELHWPPSEYPQHLHVAGDSFIVQADGRGRMAVRAAKAPAFDPVQGGPCQSNFLHIALPARIGASLDVLLPYMPIEMAILEKEFQLGWEAAREETAAFWRRESKGTTQVTVPDRLAQDSFNAMKWQTFVIAERDPFTGEHVLNTSAMHYEGVWATPFALINEYSVDALGFHAEADAYLELFRVHQGEVAPPCHHLAPHDGFLTTPAKFETIKWMSDHGAILHASAQHALLTMDPDFIKRWRPVWEKGLDWIRVQRRATKKPFATGLLPPGQATDDYQHHQFIWNDGWCHVGMRKVIDLYRRIDPKAAGRWQQEADDYRAAFQKAIRAAAKRAGTFRTLSGKVYPFVPTNVDSELALTNDQAFYLDTGPLFAVYAQLLDPHDPLMDAVLAYFREGPNVPYFRSESTPWQAPVLVHEISSCEPIYSWNVPASLARRDRVRFAEGIYSMLTGGQSQRVLWDIETRNGVFGICACKGYSLGFLRDALVRESHEGLEFLWLPPRDWLRGEGIRFERMPTWFGPMDLRVWLDGTTLHLDAALPKRDPIRTLTVHCPDLGNAAAFVVNGKEHPVDKAPASIGYPSSGRLKVRIDYH